jgi:DNA-directed RNA polymerase beta' subunit
MTITFADANVSGLSFEPWHKDKIRKFSVVEIDNVQIYENDKAAKGGLRDPMLGITSRKGHCECCHLTWSKCPGHFGHLELATPMYHAGWVSLVTKALKSVCLHCFEPITQRKKKCQTCMKQHKIVQKHDSMFIQIDQVPLLPSEALELLKKCNLTEANHAILEVLPIPPNCVRPSPTMGGDELRGEDDLTRTLLRIVRMNNTVKKHLSTGMVKKSFSNIIKKMQEVITSYIYRTKGPSSGGFATKTVCIGDRLRGKTGRVRGTLMGKRCNFTARGVITGDSKMGMHQVGVPNCVAEKLTITEVINKFNIDKWQATLEKPNNPIKFVVRADEKRLDLRFNKPTLQIGWQVEREIQDGDIALFNRQPSLHKMSIMAHEVKRMPGNTFRLNVSCTTPYNADCK